MVTPQVARALVTLAERVEQGWSVDVQRHYIFTMKNISAIVKGTARYAKFILY